MDLYCLYKSRTGVMTNMKLAEVSRTLYLERKNSNATKGQNNMTYKKENRCSERSSNAHDPSTLTPTGRKVLSHLILHTPSFQSIF